MKDITSINSDSPDLAIMSTYVICCCFALYGLGPGKNCLWTVELCNRNMKGGLNEQFELSKDSCVLYPFSLYPNFGLCSELWSRHGDGWAGCSPSPAFASHIQTHDTAIVLLLHRANLYSWPCPHSIPY